MYLSYFVYLELWWDLRVELEILRYKLRKSLDIGIGE